VRDDLLRDGEDATPAAAPPRRAPPPPVLDPNEEHDAQVRELRALYRPASNRARFNLNAHALFLQLGSTSRARSKETSGRLGGVSVDLGQSWNFVGYAVSVHAYAGRVTLTPQSGAEINATFGGGPTLTLGRLALVERGVLDVRVGYDVLYGLTQARSGTTLVASDGTTSVVADTEARIPHGPRLRIDIGLSSAGNRALRYFHAGGISFGYQALIGSLGGDMPTVNVLTLGLYYWLG
jgi:hypothetical protein